jgi:hypothetical protein
MKRSRAGEDELDPTGNNSSVSVSGPGSAGRGPIAGGRRGAWDSQSLVTS